VRMASQTAMEGGAKENQWVSADLKFEVRKYSLLRIWPIAGF
jgi:hypothetical protein